MDGSRIPGGFAVETAAQQGGSQIDIRPLRRRRERNSGQVSAYVPCGGCMACSWAENRGGHLSGSPFAADGLTDGNILLFTAPMPNSLVAIGAWLARSRKGAGKSGALAGSSYSGSKPVGLRRPVIGRAARMTRRGIMSEIEVSVLSDIACRLGEGPTYDARIDTLFWFNIVECKLLEHPLSGGETRVHELPLMASALADIDEERQLLVTETGLQIRDRATGRLTMLAEVEADRPDTRSNDARPHPCGALWFSTMSKTSEERAGAIYWFFKGEVRRLFSHITVPNSICFSPDGAIGYFADTRENRLYRVACDPETGLPVDEPVLTVDGNQMPGGIDGSVTDAQGTIWNARWGGARIDAWSPRGELIRSIRMPARQISCPAFIGRDARRLVATSAFSGMDEEARKADPHAGKTFLIDLEVEGRLDPPVLL